MGSLRGQPATRAASRRLIAKCEDRGNIENAILKVGSSNPEALTPDISLKRERRMRWCIQARTTRASPCYSNAYSSSEGAYADWGASERIECCKGAGVWYEVRRALTFRVAEALDVPDHLRSNAVDAVNTFKPVLCSIIFEHSGRTPVVSLVCNVVLGHRRRTLGIGHL